MTDRNMLASIALAELSHRYWEATLAFTPTFATYLGDRRFDERLEDRSDDAIDAHLRRLAGFRAEAEALDHTSLEGDGWITRSSLLAQIGRDRVQLESNLEAWTVDPMDGPQSNILDLEAIQPVTTPDQARAMVARWAATGPFLDARIVNLRRRAGEGVVAVRSPVQKVVKQIEDVLAQPDDDLPLLAPLAVEHPDWSETDRTAFEEGLRLAVIDHARPALRRYLEVIRDEILPVARSDDRPGLVHLPGGADAYAKLIEFHTSLPLQADDIHAVGLEEIARIDADLAVLGERAMGTSDLETIRDRLRSDPALHFASREEIRAYAEVSLQRAQEAVPEWFGRQPKADCVVVPMPAHEEAHSTIAYYRAPAPDGSRPGQYYINTSEPATRPRYEAQALAFHEAVPGHHLQLAISQELTDLPAFRRHTGPTAYFEGWGLYAERLSEEMGLYAGDLDLIGVLSFDAWRACRLVVDTGIHALGWTRRQAIDFMVERTALARNNIENEIDRYIVTPGQALAYKIGQREILRLREKARGELGDRFDIRAFHDAVLGQGPLGLDTLAEVVEAWSHA